MAWGFGFNGVEAIWDATVPAINPTLHMLGRANVNIYPNENGPSALVVVTNPMTVDSYTRLTPFDGSANFDSVKNDAGLHTPFRTVNQTYTFNMAYPDWFLNGGPHPNDFHGRI